MNKKGVGTAITMVVSLIFIALVLIIMATIFFFITPSSEVNIKAVSDQNQEEILLLNFLKTSVDGKNVADIIIAGEYDKNREILDKRLKEIILNVYGENKFAKFQINGKCYVAGGATCAVDLWENCAKVVLAGKDGDITVKFTARSKV